MSTETNPRPFSEAEVTTLLRELPDNVSVSKLSIQVGGFNGDVVVKIYPEEYGKYDWHWNYAPRTGGSAGNGGGGRYESPLAAYRDAMADFKLKLPDIR